MNDSVKVTTPTQHDPKQELAPTRIDKSRLYKTEGLVLRTIAVGEADRIVTLLTPGLGKLRVAVRGARRTKSRLGGHVDTLNRVQLSLARGRTLGVVTGADALETFSHLKSDLDQTAFAMYLADLADSLMPEDTPHPVTYSLLLESFRLIDSGKNPLPICRYAELHALVDAGFQPEFWRCLICDQNIEAAHHRYVPGLGGVVCDKCPVVEDKVMPLSINALKVFRFFLHHGLAEALTIKLKDSLLQELETLMTASIRHTLDRDIRTVAFISDLERLKKNRFTPLPHNMSS